MAVLLDLGINERKAFEYMLKQEQVDLLVEQYHQNRLEEVISSAEKLAAQNPHESILFNILGLAEEGLRQFSASISHYKTAITIRPDYSDAYYNLGNVFHEVGDLDAAIASYQRALEIDRDCDTYLNLGNALRERGDLPEAIDNYHLALQINPEYVDAYNNLGEALKEQGKYMAAIANFKQGLKLAPEHPTLNAALGLALMSLGNLEEGIRHMNIGNGVINFSLKSGITINADTSV